MSRFVLIASVLAAAVAVALTALSSGDDADRIVPVEPARETGRAASFAVRPIVSGLNRPTFVGAAPGDAGALWVLEQPGRVVRIGGGARRTVLDLRGQVELGAEQGLLGIAFHPDFATNRRLVLHWSDANGDTRIAEFRTRRDHTIDPTPLRDLLHLEQPEENHNGGQLAFGPDGRLYAGLGDGGGAFDPRRTAQDPQRLLGKIVSTDLDGAEPTRWRVEFTGLRNPWRFSFDPGLGEIWIADVGQDAIEEVNRVRLEPDEPPKNLGWSAYEGTTKITEDGEHALDQRGQLVWPVAAYTHEEGCSVTGGVVYQGAMLPGLSRRYLYGDFCAGTLWSLRPKPGGGAEDVRREEAVVPQLTHIGVDDDGELVLASAAGRLYRAVPVRAGAGS